MQKPTETSTARSPIFQSSKAMAVLALLLRQYVQANPERFAVTQHRAGSFSIRTVQIRKP